MIEFCHQQIWRLDFLLGYSLNGYFLDIKRIQNNYKYTVFYLPKVLDVMSKIVSVTDYIFNILTIVSIVNGWQLFLNHDTT